MAVNMDGFIYFVETSRLCLVKIGFARDPDERLWNLRTASPFELHLTDYFAGTKGDERAIHRFLAAHRYRGEWYRFNDTVAEFFEDLDDYRMSAWFDQQQHERRTSTPEDPLNGLWDVSVSPYIAEHCHG